MSNPTRVTWKQGAIIAAPDDECCDESCCDGGCGCGCGC